MSYARRVDRTHAEVMNALRKCGWLVQDTSRLKGWCDLTAARAGRVLLIEVKTLKGKPTSAQLELIAAGWPILTVRSADEAAKL